jgi:replicative DNA helicase Mcm
MEREDLLERFLDFINEFYKNELITAVNEGRKSISVDFSLVDKFDIELADYILEHPEDSIAAANESITRIDTGAGTPNVNVRFFNLPQTREVRIRNIRSEHIGKMIVVEGMVKRASDIRPEVSEAIFECPQCGNRMSVTQKEKMIRAPMRCDNDSCRNTKGFTIVGQNLFDARWLMVEELFEITSGERPSDLAIYLKNDLTTPRMQNKTDPGNRIRIVGVIKELPKRIKGTRSRQMDIYLEANFVESIEAEWEELEIGTEDEQRIIELANDPEIYDKLIKSIAPGIFGLDDVKEAIALQLFGGVRKTLKDKSTVRGDIHLLLVGDPSTAKSSMMKVVAGLIPRGKYVSGKGVTGAGLTATVVKDEELMGGWVLEAGALVMTNRSLLCIDEFEKVEKTDQVALHEAMEQGTISIAKATIVATLPATTSILAGGNPKLGRFDPYLPIKEQVDIPETLLTRFDLKFALRDIPNVEMDEKIAEHVLQSRFFSEEKIEPVIEVDFLKKYLSYAKKVCSPSLSREAADELKAFYLSLREKSGEDSPISITPRQYEALIRLAEASAKIQLKEEVRKEDAIRAIKLMKSSLRMFGFEPETGKIDIDRAEGQRATASQRGRIRNMIEVIEQLGAIHGKDIPIEEIYRKAREVGIESPDEILKKMLSEGMLYSPRPNVVSRV